MREETEARNKALGITTQAQQQVKQVSLKITLF